MKDKRHWFVRENSTRPKKQKLRFSRAQWKFLDVNKGVEDSLDAQFGAQKKSVKRFTH